MKGLGRYRWTIYAKVKNTRRGTKTGRKLYPGNGYGPGYEYHGFLKQYAAAPKAAPATPPTPNPTAAPVRPAPAAANPPPAVAPNSAPTATAANANLILDERLQKHPFSVL